MQKVILMLCIAVIAAAMSGCDSRNPKGELAKICESENARTPIAMGTMGKCSAIRYDKEENDVMLTCEVPSTLRHMFSEDGGKVPFRAVEPMIMYRIPRTLLDKTIEAGATLTCYVYANGTDDFFCSITFSPDENLPELIERSAPVEDDGTALSRINRFIRNRMESAPAGDSTGSGAIILSAGIEEGAFTYTWVYYDDFTIPADMRDNPSFKQEMFNAYYPLLDNFLPMFEGHSLAQDLIDTSMSCNLNLITLADGETFTITFSPDDIASFLNSAK